MFPDPVRHNKGQVTINTEGIFPHLVDVPRAMRELCLKPCCHLLLLWAGKMLKGEASAQA